MSKKSKACPKLEKSIKELENRKSKMYWQDKEQDEFLGRREKKEYRFLKRKKIEGQN